MSAASGLFSSVGAAPELVPVRQRLYERAIEPSAIAGALEASWRAAGLDASALAGCEVALLVGSRGIASLPVVVGALVELLATSGAHPFVVPSMGSHGGATAEGQLGVLASLGITEAALGCPIRSTMETVEIGTTADGTAVHLDRFAAEADAIICINRVKPHTHFRARVESGLSKMLALGAGNHLQAQSIHARGTASLGRLIPQVAAVVVARRPVLAGLALLEDGRHRLSTLEFIPGHDLAAREPELLEEARRHLPRLPLEDIDLLVVDEIGKELSGTGMDSNVTGRVGALDFAAFDEPRIGCIVVLGLSAATHGNATGVGLADLVTERLAAAVDWTATCTNAIAAQSPRLAALPIVAADDAGAIAAALRLLPGAAAPERLRIARIHNTLDLAELWLSPAALRAAGSDASLEVLGPPAALEFDAAGRLRGA